MLNAARSMQWQAKVLASVLIALGAATSATAAPITTTPQVFDFSLAQTNQVDPFAVQPYTATTLHSFNEFDAGLGTLQQVIFRWRSTLLASNTGEFDDETATINGTAEADLVGLGDLFSSPFSASASPPGNLTASVSQAVDGSRVYSAPGDLAHFIGTGTFDTLLTLSVFNTPDNNSSTMHASWGQSTNLGRLTVEYVYDRPVTGQIPEPGVLLLGSVAALAFGLTARRKRKTPH